ncbi:hypothetical protein EFY79_19760 [Hanamia caeni]|uniref:Uncharacterized protein n=1 Tax=Hanamia caeni TaxID=2294116 RepID=A0A3M9N4V7_9BACT|nr:hypothetical protein [Hanamia caeni]RNI32830.1 hypothetical protein EFY79_19760 [Hanamia caeni]
MNDSFYFLAESYNSNEILRSLIKLIPHGSIIDNKLTNFYTKEKARRLKIFYDELANGNIQLTEEVIESDDFIHKYYITLKAVLETRRDEKIQYFARLLKNSESELVNNPTDYYEDFIKVLDDLTYQELFVLKKLKEKEKEFESLQGRRLMIHKRFYRKFKIQLSEEIGITEDEVLSIFIRLGRTGCINLDKNTDQFNQVSDSIATTDFFKKLETLALT